MPSATDREIRRHILRFVHTGENGKSLSRIVYQQLLDYGHRIVWSEFDRHVLYLERAECLAVSFVHATVDRLRWLSITGKGLQVLEGSAADPGIMPPNEI